MPLGPTGYGDSPYACYSAFAGNALLISLDELVREGLLTKDDVATMHPFAADRVEFDVVHRYKESMLRIAFDTFRLAANSELKAPFADFCREQSAWLDDYALFRALKNIYNGKAWNQWQPELARRNAASLEMLRSQSFFSEDIEAQKFFQFLFFRQWFALKAHCNRRGIQLVGDIPIFVAHDSADVWTNPNQFKLNDDGSPIVVAGVPPDYFSATGQLWGNPLYNWDRMRADGFEWWIERVRATLDIRHRAHRSLPRFCRVLGNTWRRQDCGTGTLGYGARPRIVHCHQECAWPGADNCGGPGRDYA